MTYSRRNNFDLIRLLAACQVIFNHASYWLHLPVNHDLTYIIELFPGVAVFFIISGYLVTKSFIDNKGNLKLYAFSRILRIYPGLWINLIIILLLLFITNAFSVRDILSYHFISHMFLLFSAGSDCPTFICSSPPFSLTGFYKFFPSGVLWTITVELGFYLVVPLIFVSSLNKKDKKFSIIFWFSILLSICFTALNSHFILSTTTTSFLKVLIHNTIFSYLWIFLTGALIFIKWPFLSPYLINKSWIWLLIYILLSLIALKSHHDAVLNFPILTFFNVIRIISLAFFIISFAHSAKLLNSFSGKIDISYGMYLYHMQIIFTLLSLGFSKSKFLWVIVFGLTIFISTLSWFLVEKPCLDLKKKLRVKSKKLEPEILQLNEEAS